MRRPTKEESSSSAASPTESQYAAAEDAPIAIPMRLTLEQPFRLDRALMKRLRLREINTKEAFTIRDASGACFRASLKESTERGGHRARHCRGLRPSSR